MIDHFKAAFNQLLCTVTLRLLLHPFNGLFSRRLCKEITKHVIWTGRMLWIVVDERSWYRLDDDQDGGPLVGGWMFLLVLAHPGSPGQRAVKRLLLWSPYVIGQTIIFSCCGLFFFLLFFSSPNLSGQRLDVYHTFAHDVALVQI